MYKFRIFILLSFILPLLASNFKDKVVIVTGGSEGIGYSTSLLLARKGAHVVFCARDSNPKWFNGSFSQDKINSDPIVKQFGGSALFYRADIRKINQVRGFIAYTHSIYGRIDHAVNNAGIGGWAKNIDLLEDDYLFSEHDPIINNLYGVINCLKEEIRYWKKFGNPDQMYSVVSLSSMNGVRSCPGCSLYSASKYGIIGVTKSVALELVGSKPNIRVNAIAPGLVDTSLTRNQVKEGIEPWEGDYIDKNDPLWIKKKDDWINQLAGKRLAEPEELANSIISVLDNDQSYLNGAVISVDNLDTDK